MIILIVISLIMIAFVVLLISSIKSGMDSGERSANTMKNIYVYLVLFATLMMTIGGSVSVFMAIADIVSPAPYHQSFEEYRQWGPDYNGEKVEKKSEEELRIAYEEMIKNDQAQAKSRAMNTLIKSFGWIIIPLPIFIYYQRRIPRKDK